MNRKKSFADGAARALAGGPKKPRSAANMIVGGTSHTDRDLIKIELSRIQTFEQVRGVSLEELEVSELADSILETGLIEPIMVARISGSDNYGVIFGHRRLRAFQVLHEQYRWITANHGKLQELRRKDEGDPDKFSDDERTQLSRWERLIANGEGFTYIDAVIRNDLEFGNEDHAEEIYRIQLTENLQRENLTPLQEACAVHTMKERFDLSHKQLAEKLGVSKASIINSLKVARLADVLGGVKRLTPSPVDDDSDDEVAAPLLAGVNEQMRLAAGKLSRASLILLAESVDEPFFASVLKRCLNRDSARAIKAYVKNQREKVGQEGFAAPRMPRHLIDSYYSEAIRSTSNIKIDPSLLKAMRDVDEDVLADVLERVRSHAAALNNAALSRLFPGRSFRVQVSIKMLPEEKVADAGVSVEVE